MRLQKRMMISWLRIHLLGTTARETQSLGPSTYEYFPALSWNDIMDSYEYKQGSKVCQKNLTMCPELSSSGSSSYDSWNDWDDDYEKAAKGAVAGAATLLILLIVLPIIICICICVGCCYCQKTLCFANKTAPIII
jgi:hypothetical protein